MKLAKAHQYLSADIGKMVLPQLQQHRVHLLDAWRESRAEYGMPQAIRDGFYIPVPEMGVDAAVPVDYWLTQNLSKRLDETDNLLNRMYQDRT